MRYHDHYLSPELIIAIVALALFIALFVWATMTTTVVPSDWSFTW